MDLGDDFAERQAAGEESDDDSDAGAGAEEVDRESEVRRKGKGKEKAVEVDRGARRSDRTRRRDFSIVWSSLKRCYQLFLGPARFLNVSAGCVMRDSRRVEAEDCSA